MPTGPINSTNDHDFDDRETAPVARVESVNPPDAIHTRLVCDRGGIQIWALSDDEKETLA